MAKKVDLKKANPELESKAQELMQNHGLKSIWRTQDGTWFNEANNAQNHAKENKFEAPEKYTKRETTPQTSPGERQTEDKGGEGDASSSTTQDPNADDIEKTDGDNDNDNN